MQTRVAMAVIAVAVSLLAEVAAQPAERELRDVFQ